MDSMEKTALAKRIAAFISDRDPFGDHFSAYDLAQLDPAGGYIATDPPPATHHETMWFTMKPDVYGGETCDQIMPEWYCYASGDKDSDRQREPLSLDPHNFPPGTKITVEEPLCPKCGEFRHIDPTPSPPRFDAVCDCGFNWDDWTRNEFG